MTRVFEFQVLIRTGGGGGLIGEAKRAYFSLLMDKLMLGATHYNPTHNAVYLFN